MQIKDNMLNCTMKFFLSALIVKSYKVYRYKKKIIPSKKNKTKEKKQWGVINILREKKYKYPG